MILSLNEFVMNRISNRNSFYNIVFKDEFISSKEPKYAMNVTRLGKFVCVLSLLLSFKYVLV